MSLPRWSLLCAALLLVLAACAGDEVELAALQAELEERRAIDTLVDERLDTIEAELDATREELAHAVGSDELDALADEAAELDGALSALDGDLADVLAALDELHAATADAATARDELAGRVDAVAGSLERSAGELRSRIQAIEGDTASLADQLDALRTRVDRLGQAGGP